MSLASRVFAAVVVVLSSPALLPAAPANQLTPSELAEGWILLFDGQSLFGWQPASQTNWAVADGAIRASEGDPGLLTTTSQFGDYALRVDFRAASDANSGVFLRTSERPSPEDVAGRCYELNIAGPDNPFPTGSLVKRQRTAIKPSPEEWQTFEITAQAGRIAVKLNGQPAVDYTDPKPTPRGRIGLQFNRGPVEFRNVKLRPLGAKPMFNGKDLSGWKQHPESKSRITVTPEGWLHLEDGKGQLESSSLHADFTLQLEAFVNGQGINSGVFFRSIPGEMMNGYEAQIHNSFKDGDRTKPADCGTGGIFRRQNARRVVANDKEWFHLTLHADGPHMAAWVNGYQVSDWTDTRKPDKNPRKGLRLAAGSIILQGHDPTTNFYFRNLKIADLP